MIRRTVGAIAARRLDTAWSRQVRTLDLLAWTALFVGAVAGARWAAQNPERSPWLQNQATTLWLLPTAIGNDKPPVLTSLPTGALLILFAIAYASLGLTVSAIFTVPTGLLWLFIAAQRLAAERRSVS